jgi:hypothetical protein
MMLSEVVMDSHHRHLLVSEGWSNGAHPVHAEIAVKWSPMKLSCSFPCIPRIASQSLF